VVYFIIGSTYVDIVRVTANKHTTFKYIFLQSNLITDKSISKPMLHIDVIV